MDSLRADHCGYLGDDRGLTPTLDSLADAGVAYETAISPGPRTFSTMPAVFTGHHQTSNSLAVYPGETAWERRLAAIDVHLGRHGSFPERLSDLGYDTAGISPNPWTSSASGFDRGFDHFVDFSGSDDDGLLHGIADRLPVDTERRSVEMLLNMVAGKSFFTQWENFYDRLRQLTERLSEPYFLWVFLLDTHYPFITSRTHRTEQSLLGMYYSAYRSEGAMRGNTDSLAPGVAASMERSYRDTVRASDDFLTHLLDDLSSADPVTVVHSDHGESFGEHGAYGHHRGDVYEENVHVPFVVHNAGVEATISEPTSLASIHDTVLSVARQGTFDPHASTEPQVVASDVRGSSRAARGERYKLVETETGDRLFDLATDPEELRDVSAESEAIKRDLADTLESFDDHVTEVESLGRAAATVAAQRSF